MKKLILSTISLLILVTSCSKDASTPTTPTTPTPNPVSSSFTWTENSGSTNTADSAFWTTGTWGTGIRAYKGGMVNFFEINWATQDNISVGTKVLDPANFAFTFLKGSTTYTTTTSQNLSITANGSNKIDGNFNLTVAGGTITNISGTFTGLSKK